jgi:hypothetical protein
MDIILSDHQFVEWNDLIEKYHQIYKLTYNQN